MPAPFFPDVVCFANAAAKRTALALSVVKLFQEGYVPGAGTLVTDLDANEADYDDYLPITLTAWLAPTKSIYGGAEISSPLAQFTCATVQLVPNAIAGYWIELAGGDLVVVRLFDTVQPMSQIGDAVRVVGNYVFPPSA